MSSAARLGRLLAAVTCGLAGAVAARAQTTDTSANVLSVGAADIGGIVSGRTGPEAGVWVIAETLDLPTRYAKIVVTDDAGRYVIPDLPQANYKVWVRGYGLVDSERIDGKPGQTVNLTASLAPSQATAAKHYPGMYWYSMLTIPGADQFPGTGDKGNGIPEFMANQGNWIDLIKNSCQSCHALGSENIRSPHVKELGEFANSTEMWTRRIQSGQAMVRMATYMNRIGPNKGLSLFADWTDRVAEGELPFAKPERPTGLERNMVVTEWAWASPTHYMHDAISTDKRDPRVNANGYIYGSPEESTDLVPVLDPVTNKTWNVAHPYLPGTPSVVDDPHGPSVFWGEEPIWDGHTSNHNLIIDSENRVWFAARVREPANPDWCKAGGDHPSAKVTPLNESVRHFSLYDPKTGKFELIPTCFTTQHLYFGHDKDNTLWASAGFASFPAVGWLNTRKYLETHDAKSAQGWAPLIVDVPGWGKRGPYAELKEPVDPSRQKRVQAGFYGVQSSPADDTIWGQSMDSGFSAIDGQPGYIIHFIPGADPTNTALSELFQPPPGSWGPRGIDIDSKGVVWTTLSSGHLASFDRSKCQAPLTGTKAATGEQCYEGWTLYRFPGPQFVGVDNQGSANHAYYVWVDRLNTFGLGNDVPLAMTNGGEAITALVDGKMVQFHVPYPAGFFTKNVDGRIDDPNTGWKGRGLWTTSGTRTVFHNETGKGEQPRVFHIQLRPDPLAH
ncbi:MAG: carboxypeptidase-like regulatory domain-containing protein [Pseudomonadota bacterium]|nr:carboxypeptidase-like regulatory domain-containing protein [Pseudomonadota bacterium]